jgi:hypothetical protein
MSIKRVTQLELENFASGIVNADEADGNGLLSVSDVRAREIMFRKLLNDSGKVAIEEELPSWADVYQNLLTAGVRPRVAAFVAWATMPKKYRWPDTQEKLATDVLGLTSDRAIATWRKRFPEIDMMISELQAEAMLEYRPGAFRALGEMASELTYRTAADRRLFFEMTNDYTPKQKVTTDDGRGVGRKMLDQLKKRSTAELLELLGDDALELVKELEEAADPTPSVLRTSPPNDEEKERHLGEKDSDGE